MQEFNDKRIADPVHGTIGLSELEARVISTRASQRLRGVKQLGLAHYVFPGADYSRFSHSVGVCHVTGRILEALQDRGADGLDVHTIQLYRLAALLHDVGHYPFSHAMEHAIADHYSEAYYDEKTPVERGVAQEPQYYQHENLGKQVLQKDEELNEILSSAGHPPEAVSGIFTRETPLEFGNLISSDLDADRIDYLLRTAHHTGLPYGAVDLDYLLSQMRVDDKARVCLTEKALKAADHFLLCRYFDYQQVAFHKTVAGLEAVLKDVLSALISAAYINGSAQSVSVALRGGTWASFDDAFVVQQMRRFSAEGRGSPVDRMKMEAVLYRASPKLLVETETIKARSGQEAKVFRLVKRAVNDRLAHWAEQFGVDKSLWYVWDKPGLGLTKIGSHVSQSAHHERPGEDGDAYEQEIRVLDTAGATSKSIVEIPHSLMSVLSNNALYSLRVYVLLPPDKLNMRERMAEAIKRDLHDVEWN